MRYVSVFLTIFFLVSAIDTPRASAQNATATSQLSGLVIDIGDSGDGVLISPASEPYEIDGYIQEDFEIHYGSALIYVSFVQGDVTPQYWHDDSITSLSPEFNMFEVLQEDVRSDQSTALFRGVYLLDSRLYTYSEYQVGVAENVSMSAAVHSGELTFLDDLDWAMSNITIDGDPFGQLADRAEIQAAMEGSNGQAPRVIPGDITTQADWADSGLVSETEWVSPQVGTSLSWDGDLWNFPYYLPEPITIDTDDSEDVISIVTPDQRGQADVMVFRNEDVFTPEAWEAVLTSTEWIAEYEQQGFSVAIVDSAITENTASAILKLTDSFGAEYVAIYDVYITPEFTIVTHIFASPDAIGDVYQAYWDGVKANADFYPLTWTLEEIHALSDE